MSSSSPLVVLLAGPNGAGKSTSAARLLRGELAVEEFVNADTIMIMPPGAPSGPTDEPRSNASTIAG